MTPIGRRKREVMAIPIPRDVRRLLAAPNYVHLSTLRADGSPGNWVVWVGLGDEHILVRTSDAIWKAKDMHRMAPPRGRASRRPPGISPSRGRDG
jgi:hypothetical protein